MEQVLLVTLGMRPREFLGQPAALRDETAQQGAAMFQDRRLPGPAVDDRGKPGHETA